MIRRAACIGTVLAAALLGASPGAQAPAAEAPAAVAEPWKPGLRVAARFARGRVGRIAVAVRTPTRAWEWRAERQFPSASVLKAMLLVAYLNKGSVRDRPLGPGERALLAPMIRRSANRPANRLIGIVGARGLTGLARRAGMRRFVPVMGIWGTSRITASDQARFFQRIDRFVPRRHRDYAMSLLKTIVPSQRWGIAQVGPPGWRLYFKGGWGSGSGGVENQVALLKLGHQRVSVAILTENNGSHAYGKWTLRGIAWRLMRGLPLGVVP
ncbi:MAG: serine hydrolase [Solirubrobacteraceae bacterium]